MSRKPRPEDFPERAPSLFRRLACVVYDALLVLALLLVATFPFSVMTQGVPAEVSRLLLQAYVLLLTGGYFAVFWRKGQTLPMKTWRFELVSAAGGRASWGQVWLRYLLAVVNIVLLGVGWWSALFRADGQFLQDRLAGTRLVTRAPAKGG